jgi:hypothetical protein
MNDRLKVFLLLLGGVLAACLFILLFLTICVGVGCNGVPGPQGEQGKDGRGIARMEWVPNTDGTEFRFILTDSTATDWVFVPAGEQGTQGIQGLKGDKGDPGENGKVDTIKIETVLHDTIPADTVYIGSDSTSTPAGLLRGMVKIITADTCTIWFHQRWIRENGVPLDSIAWRVSLLDSLGRGTLNGEIPLSAPIAEAIPYLVRNIPYGQSVVAIRARDKAWHWSKWYLSSVDNFYIRRIVTPE